MSETAGTWDMPEYLRKVLEERQNDFILFERSTFDETATRLRRELQRDLYWSTLVARPQPMSIVITDVS